jgi:hypothetical protein
MSDTRNPFSEPSPAHTCPHCGRTAITSEGHVVADISGIWRVYRCQDYSRELLRPIEPRPSPLGVTGTRRSRTRTADYHLTLALQPTDGSTGLPHGCALP